MGAFDNTLEFIKNCSIEELTKELSKYGIEFKGKSNFNNSKCNYKQIFITVDLSYNKNSSLLRFYSNVNKLGSGCFAHTPNSDLGDNTFVISREKDVA